MPFEEIDLRVTPELAYNHEQLKIYLQQVVGHQFGGNFVFEIAKRSIDARSRQQIYVNLKVRIGESNADFPGLSWHKGLLKNVSSAPEVIIVGAGPAGLFAALKAIELGLRPLVFERGKDVQARRIDLANINKKNEVNPDSNYCFGEGGAGTYSDGKLYTRSKKRGDIQRILEILVAHGASTDILVEAHPHIGTNKLPRIIAEIRHSILDAGGQVFFNAKVTDFIVQNNVMTGVKINNQETYTAKAVLLATGHSARDIFYLLDQKKIEIQAKPFALGVRIEHQQNLIDQIQYHCKTDRGPYLPASSYSLVQQVKYQGTSWGVFSFCMCPGGFIVPSATANGEVVVNGMSPSRRNSQYSNSGIVVSVDDFDFKPYAKHGNLRALAFQAEIEKKACLVGGGTQVAPAQRMVDFTQDKVSSSLLETSYQPGLASVDMREVLPPKLSYILKEGFKAFGQKMKGYYTNESQLIGVESRTSSPVSIPRDKETLEHVQVSGFYPCGEGAGYAGGIMSAAIDGEKCMEAIFRKYFFNFKK